MASFQVDCPSCEAKVPVRDAGMVGRKIDCPKCKFRFVVKEQEEPEDVEEEIEEAAPSKKKAKATAITDKPKKSKTAADEESGDADGPDIKKKTKKVPSKLVIGGGLGLAALTALGIGGYFIFGLGGQSKKEVANNTSSFAPSSNPPITKPKPGTNTPPKGVEAPKEESPPLSQTDITNFLPNDTRAVINLSLDNLRTSSINSAMLKTPGAFNAKSFLKTFGFPLDEVSRVVMAFNDQDRWTFSVVRTSKLIKEAELVSHLQASIQEPIKQQTYYTVKRELDPLGNFLLKNPEGNYFLRGESKSSPLALRILDNNTLVFGDLEPMKKFLEDGGKPKVLFQPPTPVVPVQPGMNNPGQNPRGPGGPGQPSGPPGMTPPGGKSGGPGGPNQNSGGYTVPGPPGGTAGGPPGGGRPPGAGGPPGGTAGGPPGAGGPNQNSGGYTVPGPPGGTAGGPPGGGRPPGAGGPPGGTAGGPPGGGGPPGAGGPPGGPAGGPPSNPGRPNKGRPGSGGPGNGGGTAPATTPAAPPPQAVVGSWLTIKPELKSVLDKSDKGPKPAIISFAGDMRFLLGLLPRLREQISSNKLDTPLVSETLRDIGRFLPGAADQFKAAAVTVSNFREDRLALMAALEANSDSGLSQMRDWYTYWNMVDNPLNGGTNLSGRPGPGIPGMGGPGGNGVAGGGFRGGPPGAGNQFPPGMAMNGGPGGPPGGNNQLPGMGLNGGPGGPPGGNNQYPPGMGGINGGPGGPPGGNNQYPPGMGGINGGPGGLPGGNNQYPPGMGGINGGPGGPPGGNNQYPPGMGGINGGPGGPPGMGGTGNIPGGRGPGVNGKGFAGGNGGPGNVPTTTPPAKPRSGDWNVDWSDRTLVASINRTIKPDDYKNAMSGLSRVMIVLRGESEMVNNRSRIHELAGALMDYVQAKGQFPQGTWTKAESAETLLPIPPEKRLSWLVELLPFLPGGEFKSLGFDPTKPWSEAPNSELARLVIPQYVVRGGRPELPYRIEYPGNRDKFAATHFIGVAGVGMDASYYSANDAANKKRLGIFGYDRVTKPSDIKDGAGKTISLIMVPVDHKCPWVAGGGSTVRGIAEDADCFKRAFVCAERDGKKGTYVIMADGKVRFIAESISPDTFRALCTIDGGERIDKLDAIAPEVLPENAPQELKTTNLPIELNGKSSPEAAPQKESRPAKAEAGSNKESAGPKPGTEAKKPEVPAPAE